MTHSQPLAAPRLPGVGVDVDAGGIAIGPGNGILGSGSIAIGPGNVVGIVGFRGSRKCLKLVKV